MLVELIPKIAAMEAKDERRDAKWRPRCSSGGTDRCARADTYKALGFKSAPLAGRTILIFDDGDWHEELTFNWLRKSAWTIHSEQMPLNVGFVPNSHNGYRCAMCDQQVPSDAVHGHLDAIGTDPLGNDHVIEHKSANMFSFERWAKGIEIPWDYVTQAAFYAFGAKQHGADVSRLAVIVVKNKNNSAYMEWVIEAPTSIGANEEPTRVVSATVMEGETAAAIPLPVELSSRKFLLRDSLARFDQICRARDSKTLPDRPYTMDHWRCRFCSFASTCWDGFIAKAKVLRANAPVRLAGEDADLVRAVSAAKATAAQAKKVSDELTSKLRVRLNAMEARSATVVDGDRTLSVVVDIRERKTLDKDLIPDDVKLVATKVSEFEVLSVREHKDKNRKGKK